MNTANLRLRDRWLLALFASLFLTVGASAQNEVEIQGRVTADGQPLERLRVQYSIKTRNLFLE